MQVEQLDSVTKEIDEIENTLQNAKAGALFVIYLLIY
jgi:hypothetical protein